MNFQTLTNAEGKSTLESLVLDCGGTAEHFITLSINLLQTLVSSEEKARLGAAQRWACYRKRFRFVGREVWKMPVGCLSALSLARTRHAKSWDANPHVDLHEQANKMPDALQLCPSDKRCFTAGFFPFSGGWGESTEPLPPEHQTPSKKSADTNHKSPKYEIVYESHLYKASEVTQIA